MKYLVYVLLLVILKNLEFFLDILIKSNTNKNTIADKKKMNEEYILQVWN